MRDPRTVANTYVRSLLGSVEAHGVPACQVLRGLPVSEATLAEAHGRVGVELVRRIWQRGVELTGDGLLGLHLAGHMRPSTFRVLGYATMSCTTLGQALALLLRYQRLVSEAGMLSALTHENGDVSLHYTEQAMRVRLLPQQVEAILGGVLAQARGLAGQSLRPLAVSFCHSAQGERRCYEEFFGCEVDFEAALNSLAFAAADLQTPLAQADEDLCRMHCEMADQQLASLPPVGYVTGFAVQWLSSSASGKLRIGDLADALGLSVRSLQRQLKAEGQSWTSVVDSARREAASHLLQQGVTLDEAAQRLGYHDASSLSRAMRRWFDLPSRQLRQRLRTDNRLERPPALE